MAGRVFLAVACSAAGIQHIYHIVAAGEHLRRIEVIERCIAGRRAAVVIYYQRIFLICVEIGWQTHIAVHHGAVRCRELPRLHLAELRVAEPFLQRVVHKGGLAVVQVEQARHAVVGEAAAPVCRIAGLAVADAEATYGLQVLLAKHHNLAVRGVKLIQVAEETALADEVYLVVHGVPYRRSFQRRIEIFCHGLHRLVAQGHYESLVVEVVGDRLRVMVGADSVERIRTAHHEQTRRVGRIDGVGYETVGIVDDGVGGECAHVHLHERHAVERVLVGSLALGHVQQFRAVAADVAD